MRYYGIALHCYRELIKTLTKQVRAISECFQKRDRVFYFRDWVG
jgi:hypothetical protein